MSELILDYAKATDPNHYLQIEGGGYDIVVSPRYSIRLRHPPRIRVQMPYHTPDEPWWPEVSYGRLVVERRDGGHIRRIVYELPEFWAQPFVIDADTEPDDAVLRVRQEPAIIVGRRQIRVRRTPLRVTVGDDPAKPAEFGQPTNLKVFRDGQLIPVADWQAAEGLIELEWDIAFTDTILVDYDYRATGVLYKGFWQDGTFHAFDLNPLPGHVLVDQNGTARPVQQLLAESARIYLYLLPHQVFEGNLPVYTATGLYRLRHWVESSEVPEDEVWDAIRDHHDARGEYGPYILPLATIVIRMPYQPSHIQVIDTRRRGGGLQEGVEREEASEFTDIGRWDGPPYPENGVFILNFPKSLDPRYDASLPYRMKRARQLVEIYKAAGTLCLTLPPSNEGEA